MKLGEFTGYHAPALEADEARHNLIPGIFARASKEPEGILFWTLGQPGACVIKTAGRPILLGALSKPQSFSIAERTQGLVYPGVVGSGETALWYIERAQELGISFTEKIPQQIQALTADLATPSVPGFARQAAAGPFAFIPIFGTPPPTGAMPSLGLGQFAKAGTWSAMLPPASLADVRE